MLRFRNLLTEYRCYSKRNNVSRQQNLILISADSNLARFYSIRCNAVISNSPTTPNEVSRMTSTAQNLVLQELELPTDGTTEERREWLREYIGLTKQDV